MALSVGQVTADITGDPTGFNKAMDDVRNTGQRVARSIERRFRDVGQSMKRTGQKLTVGLTLPLVAAGTAALKTAADYEQLQQSMEILNGSAEEGARNFERLQRFAARTPFRLQGLAEAQNMLQGFGLSADQAFESLNLIGDIAAVTGGDIQGIGIAFGQAAAEGRLMTRDIRQLINQGVPAIKLLANTMDVAESEIFDLASQGQISFDILVKSFQEATAEGGQFANGMERQAQTLAGVWSTLRDNVDQALAGLGNTIVETFDLKQVIQDVTVAVQQIVARFEAMSVESRKRIIRMAALIGAGGPILVALGQAAIAISAFAKLVTSRFAFIVGAIAGTVGVIKQWRQIWNNVFGDASQPVDNVITATKKGMQELTGVFTEFITETLGLSQGLEEFQNLLSGLGQRDPDQVLNEIVQSTKDATDAFANLNNVVGGGGGAGGTSFIASINAASIAGMNLGTSLQFTNSQLKIATVSSEAMRQAEIARAETLRMAKNATDNVSVAAQRFGAIMGNALSQAVLHGNDLLDVLKNLAKQLASRAFIRGLTLLLSGGTSGLLSGIGSLFGGIFHSGGVVGGSGDRMILAQGGEGVFTPSQMRAMGTLINNRPQAVVTEGGLSRAFEIALDRKLRKLSSGELYALIQGGRRDF